MVRRNRCADQKRFIPIHNFLREEEGRRMKPKLRTVRAGEKRQYSLTVRALSMIVKVGFCIAVPLGVIALIKTLWGWVIG